MTNEELSLTVTRIYPASAERIFQAWVDPTALMTWFRPNEEMHTPHAETDLRTGGDYRLEMQAANGPIYRISGLYHEINEPVRLAFTWRWGDETEAEDTYVALSLRQLAPDQTELILFHDEFMDANERDRHEENWIGVLNQLGVYLG